MDSATDNEDNCGLDPLLYKCKHGNSLLESYSCPAEVDPSHCIETSIVRPEEPSKPFYRRRIDGGMRPALGLAETAGHGSGLGLFQAREAFGRVEVEMIGRNDSLNAEEVLESTDLAGRVVD